MKKYLPYAVIGIFVIIIIAFIAKCSRNKDVNKHNEVRLNIVNQDILETAKADKYRKTIDSLKLAVLRASSKKEIQYIPIRIKADSVVKEYVKQPTIARCDDAIVILKMQNTLADSIIGDLKKVNVLNDTLIASYKRTVSSKDKTIQSLNAGYESAIEGLRQARKPKKWTLNVGVGYGSQLVIKQGPGFLQPGPNVNITLGRNIWSF